MAPKASLHHKTVYHYDRPISLSPQEIRLKPAPHTRTPILSYDLTIRPESHALRWQQDPLGNYVGRVTFPQKTDLFEINVSLVAELTPINPFDFFIEPEAERFPFAYDKHRLKTLEPFLETEKPGPLMKSWLASIKRNPVNVMEFLVGLNRRLRQEIAYVIRPEPGLQSCEETLSKRSGSCRYSGGLLVQIPRGLKLAARFVSGYHVRMESSELHAWAEVFVPGAGWVGLDPTLGLLAGEGYIPLASAVEPSAAAPISGTTEACKTRFEYKVSVKRLSSEGDRRFAERPIATPYHEFYAEGMEPRAHYAPLAEHLRKTGPADLEAKHRQAMLTLHTEGVTFTVYSDNREGIERILPFDIIPRVIPASEWQLIESGLKQRVRALNLFLRDVYGPRKILNDGVIPTELVDNAKDYRREIIGIEPPQGIHTHISGIDIVRDEGGRYLVLEDNLRVPSGVSYMIENRVIERRVLPEFFSRYRVRRVEHYPMLLLNALRNVSPRGKNKAEVVVLTPGIYNSAYFEHTFLAKEMGVELAEGHDLTVKDDVVFLKTTHGLKRVDVVYRRIDDLFLDPLFFKNDSLVGVPGIIDAWRAGNVALCNAVGNGIADDKAIHPYVPDMIRYYLAEEPILDNVSTYQLTRDEDRAYVLDNLERMVVKAVSESGGYGMLIGPASTRATRAEFSKKIEENPRNYIAQPVIPLSRHLCYLDGSLESRHIDLRPFVIYGGEIQVVPGGLTRVALRQGSLVVNSSQGGGSKDTWVLTE